jgi:hypothetical protein
MSEEQKHTLVAGNNNIVLNYVNNDSDIDGLTIENVRHDRSIGQCPHCDNLTSLLAKYCKSCGGPVHSFLLFKIYEKDIDSIWKKMKITSFMMLLLVVGCFIPSVTFSTFFILVSFLLVPPFSIYIFILKRKVTQFEDEIESVS